MKLYRILKKMQMEKIRAEHKKHGMEGFALLEAMLSICIVTFALGALLWFIIFSLDAQKRSYRSFEMGLELQSLHDRLMGKNFDSDEMTEGNYYEYQGKFTKGWTIKNISVDLKRLCLWIRCYYGGGLVTRKCEFYKSRYFFSVKNQLVEVAND